MNREHRQREEAAISFVNLVLSQNFTKALKERKKRGKKKTKQLLPENVIVCIWVYERGRKVLRFAYEQNFWDFSALWKVKGFLA